MAADWYHRAAVVAGRRQIMMPGIVWVTGAASGVGRHLTGAFLARGWRVLATDIDRAGLDAAQSEDRWIADRVRLRRLDVDYLKIDGTLIRNIAEDPADRAVVESINRVAHALGMRTVAEHVVDTRAAERALVGADPRVLRLRRQVLVAALAVRPKLQHPLPPLRLLRRSACRRRTLP